MPIGPLMTARTLQEISISGTKLVKKTKVEGAIGTSLQSTATLELVLPRRLIGAWSEANAGDTKVLGKDSGSRSALPAAER